MVFRDWMVTTKIIQSGAGLKENDLTLCVCYILEVRFGRRGDQDEQDQQEQLGNFASSLGSHAPSQRLP